MPAIGCSFDRPELDRLRAENAELRKTVGDFERVVEGLRRRLLRAEQKIHAARLALEGDIAG